MGIKKVTAYEAHCDTCKKKFESHNDSNFFIDIELWLEEADWRVEDGKRYQIVTCSTCVEEEERKAAMKEQ